MIKSYFFTLLLIGSCWQMTFSQTNYVSYFGSAGKERFNDVVQLSDGSILVAGSVTSLAFISDTVPKRVLSLPTATPLLSTATSNIACVFRFSADYATLQSVYYLPAGTAKDVLKIKTTNRAGERTGDIFISGTREVTDFNNDGYYIAKLDGNFVNTIPTGLTWVYNLYCKPRQASGYQGESQFKTLQPWDVGGDGKVICGAGSEYDYNWAEIRRLNTNGQPEVVQNWFAHWNNASTEWDGTPASTYPNAATTPLSYSGIVLKAGRRGSMRSPTQAQYDALLPDGNGSNARKGTYPDDYYFSGPCALASTGACAGNGGYTGYRTTDKPTQRLGDIVIDRRTGDFYYGYSTQTTLPNGLPDYEPVVVAMTANGSLKWWNRLYRENTNNSTPDQYVDRLAIDYANDQLVVAARCHGNNVVNYWAGDSIAANASASGFQNRFTGTNGNIHLSWLGKMTLTSGTMRHATYVGEFVEGSNNIGAALTNLNMDAWPNPNAGWPNLNTTYINALQVSATGLVNIIGTGRRTMTTRNAYQKMPNPTSADKGSWNQFVRVYAADLSRPLYSSLLTGAWDITTGAGGDNTELKGIFKINEGVLIAGFHKVDTNNVAIGVPIPQTNALRPAPQSEDGIRGRFVADSIRTVERVVFTDVAEVSRELAIALQVYPNPTSEILHIGYANAIGMTAPMTLTVVNPLGQTMQTSVWSQGASTQSIVISTLPNGVYYLQLKNANGQLLALGRVLVAR